MSSASIAGELTFLGTGTSMGVPIIGCSCAVCNSADPHDRRLRPSVLVRWHAANRTEPAHREYSVIIDTGPDFRQQALTHRIYQLDAVFYTHEHADHILGLDDLRPISFAHYREQGPIPLYATAETRATLERIYTYTFSPTATYSSRARVDLHDFDGPIPIQGLNFIPIPLMHGNLPIVGLRFGGTAYLTDVSHIPESSFKLLEGIDTLIVSALRHEPHPSHATVSQAIDWAGRIGARQTWLTHIGHELGHEATNTLLPSNIRMAYDGLKIPVSLV